MKTTATHTATCANCKSWNSKGSDQGECRRHAPQMIVFEIDDETKIESRFPVTSADDWCGDYQAK